MTTKDLQSARSISVPAIKEGTVIDHIRAGQALKIIRILQLNANNNVVTVGLNLNSNSLGLKDIIKVENIFLSLAQAEQIAIFSSSATVNAIQSYEVATKYKVQMPETIHIVLACSNKLCITNNENVPTFFTLEERNHHPILRCKYCEKLFTRDQINEKAGLS